MRKGHVLAIVALGLAGCFTPAPEGGTSRPIEPLVQADTPPPAITGGTLLVSRDGITALASDPDRDVVWVVDLDRGELVTGIAFREGEHPWRIVQDPSGDFFVSLRDAGQIAKIDASTWTVAHRSDVCAAPRGLAYDEELDSLHVACNTGELVTVPAAGGLPSRAVRLERDLRDVVVQDDRVIVSVFKQARLLVVNRSSGTVEQTISLNDGSSGFGFGFAPVVAWRMTEMADGRLAVVHQRAQEQDVVLSQPGGYGGGGGGFEGDFGGREPAFDCGAIVKTAVSFVDVGAGRVTGSSTVAGPVLPVDMAFAPDGRVAVASAGTLNADAVFGTRQAVSLATVSPDVSDSGFGCTPSENGVRFEDGRQVVAVAFDGGGRMVTQSRDPWEIVVGETHIALPGEARKDTGHDLFHEDSGGGIACASCHAEGTDDSHTWRFEGLGPRRTQTLGGGLLGTEPFHWTGDMRDFHTLVNEVFVERMSGPKLPERYSMSLAQWIDRLPAPLPSAPRDLTAAERGRALFNDATVGCVSCHSGERLSNDATVDVGTGVLLQVPTLLGIANRAPFMHDGCAPTLRDRFGPCGGGDRHGKTSHLTSEQLDDLVAYLETL